MKEENRKYSKGDRIGVLIYLGILVSFSSGLIYLLYFTNFIKDIGLILINKFGLVGMLSIFLILVIGGYSFSDIIYKIAEFLLPLTNEEIKLRNYEKECIKKYPVNLSKLKLEEFKNELNKKEIQKKIIKLKKEMNEK